MAKYRSRIVFFCLKISDKQTILFHFRCLDCDPKLGSVNAYYLPIYPIVPLRNPDIYSHLQLLGARSLLDIQSRYILVYSLNHSLDCVLTAWHALPSILGPDWVPHQVNLHFKLMEFDPITAVLAGTQNIQLCRLNSLKTLNYVHVVFLQSCHQWSLIFAIRSFILCFLFINLLPWTIDCTYEPQYGAHETAHSKTPAILSIAATLIWQRHREQARQKKIKREYHKKVLRYWI